MEQAMNIEGKAEDLPEGDGARGGETSARGRAVRIHIDREAYQTETPTTAAALYALAEIAPGCELFREAAGDPEADFISRAAGPIRLNEADHFYTQKAYRTILKPP